MKRFLCNDDQVSNLGVVHGTSPRRVGSSAGLDVLSTPSGRFLREQSLGLPNKEGALMRPLDVAEISCDSLAKEMPCGHRGGANALPLPFTNFCRVLITTERH